ncbi:MAG: hypothetical protein AAF394_17790 [Planctomycetota bacterium]
MRKKYFSLENREIGDHVRLAVARGCDKDPPPPDNPEAYVRTISVNLERKLVENDQKARVLEEAARNEGELAEYAQVMEERSGLNLEESLQARDDVAFFARQLPEEANEGHFLSTRKFYLLCIGCGYKPADFMEKFPEMRAPEVKAHHAKLRETREYCAEILGLRQ